MRVLSLKSLLRVTESLARLRGSSKAGPPQAGGDEGDTGLGTGSLDEGEEEGSDMDTRRPHIVGRVDIYSGDSSEGGIYYINIMLLTPGAARLGRVSPNSTKSKHIGLKKC